MQTLVFENKFVEASESQSGDLFLKFVICDFDPNHNDMQLNADSEYLDECVQTLVGQPLVGKIQSYNGVEDFTGHNKKVSYKLINGKLVTIVEYDTHGLGIFTEAGIEEIEGKNYITATAKLFKRFKKAKEVILRKVENQEPIYSSWEMDIEEEHKDGSIRVFDKWQFTAHCLLGSKEGKIVAPAYDCSHITEIEVAEKQEDEIVVNDEFLGEVISAIAEDLTQDSTVEESSTIDIKEEISEDNTGGKEMADKVKEVSASLTTRDIEDKVRRLVYGLETYDCWYYNVIVYPMDFVAYAKCEGSNYSNEDYTKFVYSISSDDTVSITSQTPVKMTFVEVSEIDNQIAELEGRVSEAENSKVELSEKIVALTDQIAEKDNAIAELTPFKERVEAEEAEKAEAERVQKVAELQAFAEKGFTAEEIAENEELNNAIAELNESFVKVAVAEKLVANMEESARKKCAEEDEEDEKADEKAESSTEPKEAVAEVVLDGMVEEVESSLNIQSIYNRNRRRFGR